MQFERNTKIKDYCFLKVKLYELNIQAQEQRGIDEELMKQLDNTKEEIDKLLDELTDSE